MVAAGLSVLSFAVVLTFVLFVGWTVLRFLDFASSAIIPVVLGLFLSMLFKPYYNWMRKRVHNPTLALMLMGASLLLPLLAVCIWRACRFRRWGNLSRKRAANRSRRRAAVRSATT